MHIRQFAVLGIMLGILLCGCCSRKVNAQPGPGLRTTPQPNSLLAIGTTQTARLDADSFPDYCWIQKTSVSGSPDRFDLVMKLGRGASDPERVVRPLALTGEPVIAFVGDFRGGDIHEVVLAARDANMWYLRFFALDAGTLSITEKSSFELPREPKRGYPMDIGGDRTLELGILSNFNVAGQPPKFAVYGTVSGSYGAIVGDTSILVTGDDPSSIDPADMDDDKDIDVLIVGQVNAATRIANRQTLVNQLSQIGKIEFVPSATVATPSAP